MGDEFITRKELDEAANAIRSRTNHHPQVGLILGSGLSSLADEVEEADAIPYSEIPQFPTSTIVGHAGRLVIGRLAGQTVMVMQGRTHYYEGYSMQRITIPVRVMQILGIHTLFVTNAAGGINPGFRPGDLMLITDHINLIGMAGLNPLRGPNLDEFGPRFPDMSQAYDPVLQATARRVAAGLGFTLQEGVYMCLAGPTFETPADIRFLRTIGADAVGMSTVPEVTVARHGGTRVMGISGISNVAIVDPSEDRKTTHEEVLEAGKIIVPRLVAVLKGVLRELPPL
ncbi:MAG: purine-nucleoside phosphorylase [Anaerolineae bacterium]|jgi:purine-nucleoside phosphorylase